MREFEGASLDEMPARFARTMRPASGSGAGGGGGGRGGASGSNGAAAPSTHSRYVSVTGPLGAGGNPASSGPAAPSDPRLSNSLARTMRPASGSGAGQGGRGGASSSNGAAAPRSTRYVSVTGPLVGNPAWASTGPRQSNSNSLAPRGVGVSAQQRSASQMRDGYTRAELNALFARGLPPPLPRTGRPTVEESHAPLRSASSSSHGQELRETRAAAAPRVASPRASHVGQVLVLTNKPRHVITTFQTLLY